MASIHRSCDNVVLDLADLFLHSPAPTRDVLASTVQRMMRTLPFYDYEKGNIGEEELYALLETHTTIHASHIASAFQASRGTTKVSAETLELIRHLKLSTRLRVYGVLNSSATDWQHLGGTITSDVWSTFAGIVVSAHAGERMPNLAFFHRFLSQYNLDPTRTVFISGNVEHQISAASLGITSIPLTSCDDLAGVLRVLTRDAVADGESYLRAHAGFMWSTTNTGVELRENFAQLLMLEVTGDASLVDMPTPERRMRFFRGEGVLTTKDFPPDIDTTSIACTAMGSRYSDDEKNIIMDEIATLRNEDGITLTYFDPGRPRIDPVVCVNALTLFHSNGRGEELPETLDWVHNVLRTRAYASGTLYYHGADPFLYFLSRLLAIPRPLLLHRGLADLFKERIAERFGEPGDALALSMRILAAASIGLCDPRSYHRLLAMQEADGAWPTGWMYKYGMSGVLVGNKGLTTAMAVAAVRKFRGW